MIQLYLQITSFLCQWPDRQDSVTDSQSGSTPAIFYVDKIAIINSRQCDGTNDAGWLCHYCHVVMNG